MLELGSSQVEIRCSNQAEELKTQYLVISTRKIERVRKRLEENGILPGPDEQDPYTGKRRFSFDAPDGVQIVILEE